MAHPKFDTMEDRQSDGLIVYFSLFKWKMAQAPEQILQFCDPSLSDNLRNKLVKWLRDVNERSSSQSLQILFSFSVPSDEALNEIATLGRPIVSAGAGTGYWEFLLQRKGVDLIAFDKNTVYPKEMRYTDIMSAEPSMLSEHKERILMISWPDQDDNSTFSSECLACYSGDTIIHIGEMFGETMSINPWGQTTSKHSSFN